VEKEMTEEHHRPSSEDPDTAAWHLDKRIPVALIAATFIQFGGLVWFVASMNARVEQVTADVVEMQNDIRTITQERNDVRDRVIRIEEKIVGQNIVLDRIYKSITGN
jgi:hypothetical protein